MTINKIKNYLLKEQAQALDMYNVYTGDYVPDATKAQEKKQKMNELDIIIDILTDLQDKGVSSLDFNSFIKYLSRYHYNDIKFFTLWCIERDLTGGDR